MVPMPSPEPGRTQGEASAFGGAAEAVISRGVTRVVWMLPRHAAPAGLATAVEDRLVLAAPPLGAGDPLAAGGLQLPPLRVRISSSLPHPHAPTSARLITHDPKNQFLHFVFEEM
jgi:hypothetical protein